MSIVASGILPNSPLLLPKLSPLVIKRTSRTREAIDKLLHEMYARQPDIVMLISSAGQPADVTSLLQASTLKYSFFPWGDVVTKGEVKLATGFTHKLKESMETSFPIILKSVDELPVYFAVPTLYLQNILSWQNYIFLEIANSLGFDELYKLAKYIKEQINQSTSRILLVVCGNLSEHFGRYQEQATVFDRSFQAALISLNSSGLADLKQSKPKGLRESLLNQSLLLSLILADLPIQVSIFSYEVPARVGYLVAGINEK